MFFTFHQIGSLESSGAYSKYIQRNKTPPIKDKRA